MKCEDCERWFYTERALNIHWAKVHKNPVVRVPDLAQICNLKRDKLTREEARRITKEVCEMTNDTDVRFNLAIIKTVETLQKGDA